MKGILAVAVVCLLADFTDASVTSWIETDFTVSAGTGTPSVTMKYNNKVTETSTAADAIVTLSALPAGSYTYTLPTALNPDAIGTIATASSGAITLAT
ncbi:hypothetical protein DPMN_151635 [Dreissena polymorpha]|uniref:DUF4198 domain-containing protein n=1 Tax=Dreissena polymorpha TaxID=45954 RepID=A0A9D4FKC8_DREPO|nr:hypothetical protein DPMN_151635 [Dreissena polymorpha]